VKGIERTIIGIEAAEKEIDAAMPLMRDETKVIPSTSIDERSSSKGMRHDPTDETEATFGFLSAPTCLTATRNELDAGLDAFHADLIGMADEAKSLTSRESSEEVARPQACEEFSDGQNVDPVLGPPRAWHHAGEDSSSDRTVILLEGAQSFEVIG
jgi:hypothetical protein